MESATLTRPRPGASLRARLRAVPFATFERGALCLLAFGAAAGLVLAVIDRSLAISAPGLLIFGAFARAWAVTNFSLDRIDRELTGRERIRDALEGVLTAPAVQRARSCGPVTVPTHNGRNTRGLHVSLWGESMLRNTAYGPSASWVQEPPPILVPGDDAQGVARTEGLVAHASC